MPREACLPTRSSAPPNPLACAASRCHDDCDMGAGTSNEAAHANRLGMDALRSGDPAAAAAHFAEACRADPTAGELWINLAHAHRLLDDTESERGALEQALGTDQRNLM